MFLLLAPHLSLAGLLSLRDLLGQPGLPWLLSCFVCGIHSERWCDGFCQEMYLDGMMQVEDEEFWWALRKNTAIKLFEQGHMGV